MSLTLEVALEDPEQLAALDTESACVIFASQWTMRPEWKIAKLAIKWCLGPQRSEESMKKVLECVRWSLIPEEKLVAISRSKKFSRARVGKIFPEFRGYMVSSKILERSPGKVPRICHPLRLGSEQWHPHPGLVFEDGKKHTGPGVYNIIPNPDDFEVDMNTTEFVRFAAFNEKVGTVSAAYWLSLASEDVSCRVPVKVVRCSDSKVSLVNGQFFRFEFPEWNNEDVWFAVFRGKIEDLDDSSPSRLADAITE